MTLDSTWLPTASAEFDVSPMSDFWIAIFSSSLLSGIFGALIAGAFGLRGKRNDYVNDYFKTIIKRRLEAYERLEQLINTLKLTVLLLWGFSAAPGFASMRCDGFKPFLASGVCAAIAVSYCFCSAVPICALRFSMCRAHLQTTARPSGIRA